MPARGFSPAVFIGLFLLVGCSGDNQKVDELKAAEAKRFPKEFELIVQALRAQLVAEQLSDESIQLFSNDAAFAEYITSATDELGFKKFSKLGFGGGEVGVCLNRSAWANNSPENPIHAWVAIPKYDVTRYIVVSTEGDVREEPYENLQASALKEAGWATFTRKMLPE